MVTVQTLDLSNWLPKIRCRWGSTALLHLLQNGISPADPLAACPHHSTEPSCSLRCFFTKSPGFVRSFPFRPARNPGKLCVRRDDRVNELPSPSSTGTRIGKRSAFGGGAQCALQRTLNAFFEAGMRPGTYPARSIYLPRPSKTFIKQPRQAAIHQPHEQLPTPIQRRKPSGQ